MVGFTRHRRNQNLILPFSTSHYQKSIYSFLSPFIPLLSMHLFILLFLHQYIYSSSLDPSIPSAIHSSFMPLILPFSHSISIPRNFPSLFHHPPSVHLPSHSLHPPLPSFLHTSFSTHEDLSNETRRMISAPINFHFPPVAGFISLSCY